MGDADRRGLPSTLTATGAGGNRSEPSSPTELERYEILGQVAQGGLGVILRAHDRWLGREVALKLVIRKEPAHLHRFRREIMLTAQLQHPSIIPLHDSGETADGVPFYAMKLVSGRSLGEALAARTLEERLALLPRVLAVAEAIAYAHSQGVVHRDLKPSNVLLGDFEETVVIDWGLAKHVSEPAEDPAVPSSAVDARLTIVGEVVGTPAYMPPEQAEGLDRCGMPGDVYALGAMVFHLLTGKPPFSGDAGNVIDALRRGEPAAAVESIEPGAPRDLVAIVRKAMARDPRDRYASAESFIDDLRRFLTGQLVAARRYSWLDLVTRFLRRYPWRLAIAAAVLTLATTQTVISVRRVMAARLAAEIEADARFFAEVEAIMDSDPTRAAAILKTYPGRAPNPRRAATLGLEAVDKGVASQVIVIPGRGLGRLAFTSDGKSVAAGLHDGTIEVWTTTGRSRTVLTPKHDRAPTAISPLPDGGLVTCADDGRILLWDTLGAGGRQALQRKPACTALSKLHDGRVLARFDDGLVSLDRQSGAWQFWPAAAGKAVFASSGSRAAFLEPTQVRIVDSSGAGIAMVPVRAPRLAQFSPDGHRIVVVGDHEIDEWSDGGATRRLEGVAAQEVQQLSIPDRGDRVVINTREGLVTLAPGRPAARLSLPPAMRRLIPIPAADAVAVPDGTGMIRLVSLGTLEARVLHGHKGMIWDVALSADGRQMASSGRDGRIRIWPVDVPREKLTHVPYLVLSLTWSPDGSWILIDGGSTSLWRIADGTLTEVANKGSPKVAAAVDRDFQHVAAPDGNGGVVVREIATGVVRRLSGSASGLVYTAKGRLAIGRNDGAVQLLDTADGEPREIGRRVSPVVAVSSEGGERVAVAWEDGIAQVIDGDSGQRWEASLGRKPTDVVISPTGDAVALVSVEKAFLWHVGGKNIRELAGPTLDLLTVRWTPDGASLLASSRDASLWIWDSRTGEGHLLATGSMEILTFGLTNQGRQVIGATLDGNVMVLPTDGGPRRILLSDPQEIYTVALSNDGAWLATGNGFGRVVVHPFAATPDWGKVDWRAWLERQTSVSLADLPALR